MFHGKIEKLPDGAFLLHTAAAWTVSACLLLCVGSALANAAGMGEQGISYLSSCLSFLCAAAAGAAASRRAGTAGLWTALMTGTFLVILLLTLGFLIQGQDMDPASILSLVSFTYAGALVGVLLMPKKRKKTQKRYAYKRT